MNAQQQARLDRVVSGVMGAVLDDCRRGVLTREDVDKRAGRLLNSIQAEYRAAVPSGHQPCSACAHAVSPDDGAVIGGRFLCKQCAPKHRRAPPPRFAP